ncbi:hypothetical protein AMK26_33285 [Streptomyces sp. CB03234]|uniref:TOMM precursor leader peptide-binding protein n=1 Tax=Streptomyces sp. (strain CB03234) TaxID=1703937 RepID=UPI00093E978A|nr:hypothetical protein AMK26_33285 [Streptomyces sp. CB03234]
MGLPLSAAPLVGFKRHLRVEVVPGEGVYLLSEHGVKVLRGQAVEVLAPLLDGTRTLPGVIREAEPLVPPVSTGRILAKLAKTALIRYYDSQPTGPCDQAASAYWDLMGLDGDGASRALSQGRVRLVAVGQADVGAARHACRESGVIVSEEDDEAALTLVLCDDYLAPGLAAVDALHRAAGRPWLLAKPYGTTPWVGPVFTPGAGPCWSCLAHRLRAHRTAEVPAQRAIGSTEPVRRPAASLAAGRTIGLQLAVLETAKWLAGARGDITKGLCSLDTLTLRSRTHPVRQRPQCRECGDTGLVRQQVRRPLTVRSRPKATLSGGHRALTPHEMLARYEHLISPITGIVGEIVRDHRLPEGLNAYISGRNLALRCTTLAEVRGGLRSLSGGKGVTATEARTGALCEAAERYSATWQGDEPTVRDTLLGLGGDAVHPNDCQLFDERQFRDRERWNATHSAFHQVSAPFPVDRPVDWTPVWSFTAGVHRMLPTSMLYFGHDRDASASTPWADSNGNAAGSSVEDAVVQGFLELVERDAVAVWWYNRTRQPGVDLDAFDQPWLADIRDAYGRVNRRVWALDLTSDLGIPVMAALSRRIDKPTEDIVLGFGAHFDPRIALRRAITEMGQFLPAVALATADGGGYALSEPELVSWWRTATVRNQPYLTADPATASRAPRDFDYVPRSDLRDDVEACKALVRAHAMELLVLDQTRPDVAIPVVKVIVPGMRHFWTRFGPGRLYDVPVTLGHLSAPRSYEELNPIPLFT